MEEKCTCRRIGCKRHGNCAACREYHRTCERYPVPSCEKKKKSAPVKRADF